jgi:hypothetical protein
MKPAICPVCGAVYSTAQTALARLLDAMLHRHVVKPEEPAPDDLPF